jgi:hypothetical protein
MNQNCAHCILVCDIKVVGIDYCRNREVIQMGYRCTEHALPYGVVAHDKYGCTCSNLCA